MSEQGPVEGFCEHDDNPSSSTIVGNFLTRVVTFGFKETPCIMKSVIIIKVIKICFLNLHNHCLFLSLSISQFRCFHL